MRASVAVVLGGGIGRRQRDDLPRGVENVVAFLRVERGQAAGGSRSDVHEPPAGREPLDDRVDCARDVDARGADGLGDRGVPGVDQLDELQRRTKRVLGVRSASRLRSEFVELVQVG